MWQINPLRPIRLDTARFIRAYRVPV